MPMISLVENFYCGRCWVGRFGSTLNLYFIYDGRRGKRFAASLAHLDLKAPDVLPPGLYALPDDWEKIRRILAEDNDDYINENFGTKAIEYSLARQKFQNNNIDVLDLDVTFVTKRGHACDPCDRLQKENEKNGEKRKYYYVSDPLKKMITIYKMNPKMYLDFPKKALEHFRSLQQEHSNVVTLFMNYSCHLYDKNEQCTIRPESLQCRPYDVYYSA